MSRGKRVVVVFDCRIAGIRRGLVVVVAGGIVVVVVGKGAVGGAGSMRGVFVVVQGPRMRNGKLIGLAIGVRRCCRVHPLRMFELRNKGR